MGGGFKGSLLAFGFLFFFSPEGLPNLVVEAPRRTEKIKRYGLIYEEGFLHKN